MPRSEPARGMRDFLPEDVRRREYVISIIKRVYERYGFEVIGEEYVDMVKEGIIDPVKVTRSALENAVSVAGMILTTEALVTEIPTPEPPMPAMPEMDDY